MNIYEKIEQLEKELAELKAELKAEVAKPKKWMPKDRDNVFIVQGDGEVFSTTVNREIILYLKRGRMFHTKEEAEFFSEQDLVQSELWALEDDEEWDGENRHWFISYDLYKQELKAESLCITLYDIPYFKSRESAQSAIDTVGEDRIKKYLFGWNNKISI